MSRQAPGPVGGRARGRGVREDVQVSRPEPTERSEGRRFDQAGGRDGRGTGVAVNAMCAAQASDDVLAELRPFPPNCFLIFDFYACGIMRISPRPFLFTL